MGIPTRSCVACRRRWNKPALTRLAIANGTVVLDPSATMSGRGAYLCSDPSCAAAALGRGSIRLRRALRADSTVHIDETELQQLLRQSLEPRSTSNAGVSE